MKRVILKTPKFKIGDIVRMVDEFHFNPCYKTVSVGRVEAIHFQHGAEFGFYPAKGETKPKSVEGRILYTVSGFSLMPEEKDLQLYEEVK